MCGIGFFVLEYLIKFEDFVEIIYDVVFEEQFWCDLQVQIDVQGIGMSGEWMGCCIIG